MSISNIAEGIGSYNNAVNRYFAALSMTFECWVNIYIIAYTFTLCEK